MARARISETVCIFRPAIVPWSILASDAVTVIWLILFNVERRVVLRRSRSSLLACVLLYISDDHTSHRSLTEATCHRRLNLFTARKPCGSLTTLTTLQPAHSLADSYGFDSRPNDHYFRSVCLSVCLFVCAEFFSAVFDPISIKLGHMLYVWV